MVHLRDEKRRKALERQIRDNLDTISALNHGILKLKNYANFNKGGLRL
jgi:hypothetical protein